MLNRTDSGTAIYLLTMLLLTGGWTSFLYASELAGTNTGAVENYLLTQNENGTPEKPAPGTLILPSDNSEKKGEEEKKCMTVCAQWGEECNYINRGSAGTTRSCRRMCKQYTEECF